jgi:hypothetical protein
VKTIGVDDRRSPAPLLHQWEEFVRQRESVYGFGIYEFENDITVRDQIQRLLDELLLRTHTQLGEFETEVFRVDERLRTLLRPDVTIDPDSQYWWRRGVLRAAGHEYRRDIAELFDICEEENG